MTVTINNWSTTAGSNGSTLGTVAEGAWPENTMQSQDINNAAREMMAVLARWHKDNNGSLTTAGTQPVYTVASPNQSSLSAYYDGFTVMVDFHATNSSATVPPTLNINSLGAKDMVWPDGTDLAQNQITAGMKAWCVYDGAKFQVLTLNGAPNSFTELSQDTSPQLGGDLDLNGNNIDFPTTANISDCLDEDNMASDSATALATQQSIKAYVDSQSSTTTYLLYQDRQTSGTAGPSYTSGSWRKVQMSTEVTDTGSNGSVASDVMTLDAGTYEAWGWASVMLASTSNNKQRLRLRDTTGAATLLLGNTTGAQESGGQKITVTPSIVGHFTLGAQSDLELQIYPSGASTSATEAMSTGEQEVYASLYLRKIA